MNPSAESQRIHIIWPFLLQIADHTAMVQSARTLYTRPRILKPTFWRQCLHMARCPIVRAWKPTSTRLSLALQKLFYSCLMALHNFLNLGLFCCLHDSNHHWYPQQPKMCQESCFSPRMKVNFPCWSIWEVYVFHAGLFICYDIITNDENVPVHKNTRKIETKWFKVTF